MTIGEPRGESGLVKRLNGLRRNAFSLGDNIQNSLSSSKNLGKISLLAGMLAYTTGCEILTVNQRPDGTKVYNLATDEFWYGMGIGPNPETMHSGNNANSQRTSNATSEKKESTKVDYSKVNYFIDKNNNGLMDEDELFYKDSFYSEEEIRLVNYIAPKNVTLGDKIYLRVYNNKGKMIASSYMFEVSENSDAFYITNLSGIKDNLEEGKNELIVNIGTGRGRLLRSYPIMIFRPS